jgi:hypothetical protein
MAMGLFGFGLMNEAPAISQASTNCAGQEIAGRWMNTAKPDGSDILSANIQIPCTASVAAAGLAGPALTPKIALQLSVRCMHVLICDWQPVPASWTRPEKQGDPRLLAARYEQDRFDRDVTIEPTDDGKLKLTLTSRLKGLAVAPVRSIYLLERSKV